MSKVKLDEFDKSNKNSDIMIDSGIACLFYLQLSIQSMSVVGTEKNYFLKFNVHVIGSN